MSAKYFDNSRKFKCDIYRYEIKNKNGMTVNIITIGAAIQSIYLPWKNPSKSDNPLNVVLGYDNAYDYEQNPCYLGVVAGRVAGRISDGSFMVDETEYDITVNNGPNCLHGGHAGLTFKIWNYVEGSLKSDSVQLECVSYHGEDGFPGDLIVRVRYTVNDNNALLIDYEAELFDVTGCPLNLTNHSYFNLSGVECTEIGVKDHKVEILSSKTLELDENLIPTGQTVSLDDSPLDLRPTNEGSRLLRPLLNSIQSDETIPPGFDNYYILDNYKPDWHDWSDLGHHQAKVIDNYNTTAMYVYTNQRGIQFYTSNYFGDVGVCGPNNLNRQCSKEHFTHKMHGALCLETQDFPDCINHFKDQSEMAILRPGQVYQQSTMYRFENLNKQDA